MSVVSSVAFIGGGNMARSLIGGLIARGTTAADIRVSEPVEALREALSGDFGVNVGADNAAAASGAGLWLLAVKPQVMRTVCETLAPLVEFCRAPRRAADLASLVGDPEERATAYRRERPSLRDDLALAKRYLKAGGVAEVGRRAMGRVRRTGA